MFRLSGDLKNCANNLRKSLTRPAAERDEEIVSALAGIEASTDRDAVAAAVAEGDDNAGSLSYNWTESATRRRNGM